MVDFTEGETTASTVEAAASTAVEGEGTGNAVSTHYNDIDEMEK